MCITGRIRALAESVIFQYVTVVPKCSKTSLLSFHGIMVSPVCGQCVNLCLHNYCVLSPSEPKSSLVVEICFSVSIENPTTVLSVNWKCAQLLQQLRLSAHH